MVDRDVRPRREGSAVTAGGRAVGFAEWGDPDGRPVVAFHGGPGSRLMAVGCEELADELGLRIVILERPGFGLSEYASDRTLLGWTDDVAALMHSATLLITKPGGVTIAEASLCGLPAVLFDPIPGPEQTNAARLANAGAAMVTNGVEETVAAAISLLNDDRARRAVSAKARELARPDAATNIARIILNRESSREVARTKTA